MLPVLVVPSPRPRRHFGAAAGGVHPIINGVSALGGRLPDRPPAPEVFRKSRRRRRRFRIHSHAPGTCRLSPTEDGRTVPTVRWQAGHGRDTMIRTRAAAARRMALAVTLALGGALLPAG